MENKINSIDIIKSKIKARKLDPNDPVIKNLIQKTKEKQKQLLEKVKNFDWSCLETVVHSCAMFRRT